MSGISRARKTDYSDLWVVIIEQPFILDNLFVGDKGLFFFYYSVIIA